MTFIRGHSGRFPSQQKIKTKISPYNHHQKGNIVTFRITTEPQPKSKSNKWVTLQRFCNTQKVTL